MPQRCFSQRIPLVWTPSSFRTSAQGLARALVPDLVIHGSTQMSITSAAVLAQAAALGCQRVVLARELALANLERLGGQLQQRHLAMPLEVFIHGALCVAYSGQCLTSESLGQRSANRGECAQACRLPYELVVDGESRLGEQRYLLSPQDWRHGIWFLELARLGIASLKIEGRLKDASYVAAVTDAYRHQLDRDMMREVDSTTVMRQMELAFSRGLSHGWLEGVNHRRLVHGRWSKKRSPLIGRLLRVDAQGWLQLRTQEALRNGQGWFWRCPRRTLCNPLRKSAAGSWPVSPSVVIVSVSGLGPVAVTLRH